MTQCLLTKSARRQIHFFTKTKKEAISKATITLSVLILLMQQNVDSLVKRHRHYVWDFARKNFPDYQALVVTHTDGNNGSGNIHERLCKAGISHDAAGYATPQGLRNVLIISATPYQWKHMIGQRCCRRNTGEMRIVMLLIWQNLYELSRYSSSGLSFTLQR